MTSPPPSSQTESVLRAVTFNYPPFDTVDPDDGSHGGIEVSILEVVSASLGLRLEISPPTNGFWGEFLPNGTITGILGDLHGDRGDVGCAQFFLSGDRIKVFAASELYMFDGYCFHVPRPRPEAQWKAFFRPLSTKVWIASLITLLTLLVFLHVAHKRLPAAGKAIGDPFLLAWSLFFNQSRDYKPLQISFRVFYALVHFSTMILLVGYSGGLVSNLAMTLYPPMPDKLFSLTSLSGNIGAYEGAEKESILSKDNPLEFLKPLAETKYEAVQYSDTDVWNRVDQGRLAFLDSKTAAEYIIRKSFTDKYGEASIVDISQCWAVPQIVFYFGKDKVELRDRFNVVLRRLRESGITDKWLRDEMDAVKLVNKRGRKERYELGNTSISPRDVFPISALVLVLLGLAAVVFWTETFCRSSNVTLLNEKCENYTTGQK